MPPSKRKTRVAAYVYDAKLQRVARALDNLNRVGAPMATGTSERYPPIGLAFKGDADGELHFPLGKPDEQKIKSRAAAAQEKQWEVRGDLLEQRNPRWQEFLKECLDSKRGALGISAAAAIELSLSKMVVQDAGARLQVRREGESKGEGVFGSLVIAMPGTFKGGSIEFEAPAKDPAPAKASQAPGKPGQAPAKDRTPTWRATTRKTNYDLTYAAFYDQCAYEAKPTTGGTAVFLVYDIATTTPGEVPLYGGYDSVHGSLHAALTDYFDVTPEPLAKRLKINTDAWGTINEFTCARQFVYMVGSKSVQKFTPVEQQVAARLATFCANSNGQFVLYQARLLCSRESDKHKGRGYHDPFKQDDGELKLTLMKPWIKYGETKKSNFPSMPVQQLRDVTPLGRAEDIKLYVDVYDMDMDIYDVIEFTHHNYRQTGSAETYALVVLPASIEWKQLVQMPFEEVNAKLRSFLPDSRDEALRFARGVIQHHSSWKYNTQGETNLRDFAASVIEINDLQLFKDLVLKITLSKRDDSGFLRPTIDQFGWDACVETIAKRILSTDMAYNRINLVDAVVDACSGSARINQLPTPLLSLHPWTDVKVAESEGTRTHSYEGEIKSFGRLFMLANALSLETLLQTVSVTCPNTLIHAVIPALGKIKHQLDPSLLQPIVSRLSSLLHKATLVYRNEVFAKIQLPAHCEKCNGLQAFLKSTATQTTMQYTGTATQLKHFDTVFKRAFEPKGWGCFAKVAAVTVQGAGANAARLTKVPADSSPDAALRAQEILNVLADPTADPAGSEERYSRPW